MIHKRPWLLWTVAVFASTVTFSACSLGGGESAPNFARMALQNATNLFIVPSGGSGRSTAASTGDKLFKITSSGYVQQVTYEDSSGNPVTVDQQPTAVYNADSSYVIVCFGYANINGGGCPYGYLVRKADGAAYSLDNVGTPSAYSLTLQFDNFTDAAPVQTDGNGNIYYETYPQNTTPAQTRIVKINTADPNNLQATDVSPSTDIVYGFDVTPAGNIVYAYSDPTNGTQYRRIRKANGGLANLPNSIVYWIGLNGKIQYQDPLNGTNTITTVSIDSSYNVTSTTSPGVPVGGTYILKFPTRLLTIGSSGLIAEVQNPSNSPRTVTISQISQIQHVGKSDNYYYLAGLDSSNNPVLLKIDPSTDAVTQLLPQGGTSYDIYAMTVSPNDIVEFNALRMSDGAKIIGQIDANGNLSILDATINSKVVSLVRIN